MVEGRRSALLVGATGLVGSELLKLLLENSTYDLVKVFVRKRMATEHPKLEQVVVDFDYLENFKEHFTVNDLYCCLGTTIKKAGSKEEFRKVDFEYPHTLAKLAKSNGVNKYLIISAIGASVNAKSFYSRVKGEIEEELKNIELPAVHIFQPSLLLGKRKEFRLGEKIAAVISPAFSFVMIGSLRKYKPIQAVDVARAMYKVGHEQLIGNHTYKSDEIVELSHSLLE